MPNNILRLKSYTVVYKLHINCNGDLNSLILTTSDKLRCYLDENIQFISDKQLMLSR